MDKNSIRVSLFIVYYNPYFCKCWIKIPVEFRCLLYMINSIFTSVA